MSKLKLRGSGLEDMEGCPYSYPASQGAPELPQSSDATSGDNIHADLAGEDSELSSDEEETRDMIAQRVAEVRNGLPEPDVTYQEQEFTLSHPLADISGHPDLVTIHGSLCCLDDYKTGRRAVSHAGENLQLGTYALMIAAIHPEIDEFWLTIHQPWAQGGGSHAEFRRSDLVVFWHRITRICERILAGDEPPNPSEDRCYYCDGITDCPAKRAQITQVSRFDLDPARWALATVEERIAVYELAKQAARVCSIMKGLIAKELRENAMAYNGEYFLKPGKDITTLSDPQAFFSALHEASGVDGSDIVKCAKFRLGDNEDGPGLDRIVKERTGGTMKDAKQLVRDLMKAYGSTEKAKPSLERRKG